MKGSKEVEAGAHITPYPCSEDIPGSGHQQQAPSQHRRSGSSDPARERSMSGATPGALVMLYSPFVLSSCNFVILSLSCQ